jgi:hypothetical protein
MKEAYELSAIGHEPILGPDQRLFGQFPGVGGGTVIFKTT